jgi:hypothetical protein
MLRRMETKERNPFTEAMDHIALRRAKCAHRELKLETHSSYLTGFYICQECGERLLAR